MPTSSYDIPDFRRPPGQIHGWCLEAQQEGDAWLKTQRPTLQWDSALQVLSEPDTPTIDTGLSNLGYNKVKRMAREQVAALSNFRHEGEFKVTWNDQLWDTAHALTNLDEHWYRSTRAWAQHRAGLQYGVAVGTAYWSIGWDKHFWSPYRGDISLRTHAPGDVTFVQLPKNHDIQQAYCTIVREELPLNLAKAIYADTNPEFAASLVPDRDAPGWLAKGLQKLQKFVAPALRVAGRMPTQAAQASFPTVDIFHMYVLDRSINDSGSPISIGVPGTNWAYSVPSIGDPIQTSQVNPATGNFFTVPATEADCKLWPLRRYVIFSRTGLCYDSTSPNWHGQTPVTRLRFTDWAWEALGQSQIADSISMQTGIIELMRGIEDAHAARLNPPGVFDDRLADTWAQAINPRLAGGRSKAPLDQIPEPYKPFLPPQYYDVPPAITEWISQQEARMDYMSCVTDLVAIAKAKQVPGSDTLEKLMEMAGPIVQDLVRSLEEPLVQLGEWRKALYFQYYTSPRMLTITGPEGVTIDTLYKPEQLARIQTGETPQQFATRKRGYLEDFRYCVTESGINEIHRLSNKLLYIQLQKLGLPIDPWTIAKVCQIPQYGPEPIGTNNVMERWTAWQHMQAELQAEVAGTGMQAAAEQGILPMGGGGAGADGNGGPPSGNGNTPGGGGPEGRPPSMQKAPRLEQKDGGTRSTIATS